MIRKAILRTLTFFAFAASTAHAQTLRIESNGTTQTFTGVSRNTTLYPLSVLKAIGASATTDRAGTLLAIFGDTVRIRAGSPFFSAHGTIYQLAFNIDSIDGQLYAPEQFFIQWLPSSFGSRVRYIDGALRVSSTAVVVATPAPPVTPAASLPVTRTRADSSPRSTRTTSSASGTAKRIVVLDPGHGGVDSGAKGPNGLQEKDACLMIANRLAAVLRSRGYEVHMTRTTDTLISLADRPRMANQWKGSEPGALYVSIHNNSGVSAAHGFETYFLADASTADERRVADMENASVKYEKNTAAAGTGLDQVLNGLRNDFYMRTSNAFADVVQHDMSEFHPGPNRGVKRANFRVLIGALMPAVLVEVAFISNPHEADLLGTAAFQDKLAYSLAKAVDTFFQENEPLWVKQ